MVLVAVAVGTGALVVVSSGTYDDTSLEDNLLFHQQLGTKMLLFQNFNIYAINGVMTNFFVKKFVK